MNGDEIVAIPIILFLVIGVISITAIISRHRERMAMMTRGLGAEEIKALYARSLRTQSDPLTALKWGILFIFGGLAVLVGNFLHEHYMVDDSVIVGLVCLFAGFALLLFYGIAAKRINEVKI